MDRRVLVYVYLLFMLSACNLSSTPSPVASTFDRSPAAQPLPTGQPLASPEPTRVRGVISFFDEGTDDVVQLPDQIRANTPFDITISTFGSGCHSVGDADVNVEGNTAIIIVYDLLVLNTACPEPLLRFPRTVSLQFPQPGPVLIRVEGQRLGPETKDYLGTPTVIERHINVQ